MYRRAIENNARWMIGQRMMGAKIIRAKHPEYEQTLSFLQRSSVAGQGQGLGSWIKPGSIGRLPFRGEYACQFWTRGRGTQAWGKEDGPFIFASFLVCMASSWYRERYLSSLFDQAWLCALCKVCLLERCEH